MLNPEPASNVTPADNASAASGDQNSRKPLGQKLLDAGMITEIQLALALREHKRQGKMVGEVLVDLGFVSPEALTGALAVETKTEVADVVNTSIDSDVLALISYDDAKKYTMIPLQEDKGIITVALADAFNVVAIDHVEKETGMTVSVVSAPENAILEALERNYSHGQSIMETIDKLIEQDVDANDVNIETISPMVRLVDQIIAIGVKKGAADIHIEPDEKFVRVRYRVDGVLRSDVLIPGDFRAAMTARVKLMAEMNISETRVPQDGRIHFMYGSNEIDLRVSTLPTNHGESIVMRILDTSSMSLTLDNLGFSVQDRSDFLEMVNRPYGMMLVTGPTGSGKTTTLYTALNQVDTETRSVFTLEDPIEYTIPMIRQTQIKPDVGMDYASGLRALLRQDPDVILIGEIRDLETAELAIRAALTGHLVLSTLHTNSAAGVVPRLIDMGVERYMLPAALNAAIGQRLVRKLCDECKQPLADSQKVIDRYGIESIMPAEHELYEACGCDACNGSGYQSRLAIYEMMQFDEAMHDPLINGSSASELEKLARSRGMKLMVEDGLAKAAQGLTTVDEIMRLVR